VPPLDFEAFPTCKLQILFLRIADQQRAESSAMRSSRASSYRTSKGGT
jgi:hypothetical protein